MTDDELQARRQPPATTPPPRRTAPLDATARMPRYPPPRARLATCHVVLGSRGPADAAQGGKGRGERGGLLGAQWHSHMTPNLCGAQMVIDFCDKDSR
eukprot:2625700-Prymnesium_polylepis.1